MILFLETHWDRFAVCFLAAFAVYVQLRNKGLSPYSVLKAFNFSVSRRARPRVIVFDCVLTSLLGSIVAYAAIVPATHPQAVAAGLSFIGLIASSARPDNKEPASHDE